jgi:hypothetical protein
MEELLASLQAAYPQLSFKAGERLRWSPGDRCVYYVEETGSEPIWGMLHEVGHALLGHSSFKSDVGLVNMEVAAWQYASLLSKQYGLKISSNFVDDCLDSYRDWLHKRSTCPTCDSHGLQTLQNTYLCINCSQAWQVSSSNDCRPYRRSVGHTK